MKPVRDETLDELEKTAIDSAKSIREYLAYKGNDTRYREQARVAAGAISAFARTRASESNRAAIELMARRVDGHEPKKITA